MDNKKWYKKFATIFWWSFTILPLVITIIYFIGYHLTFNSGIDTAQELANYHNNSYGSFMVYFSDILTQFDNFTMVGLKNAFNGLFDILGVSSYSVLGVFFAYMLSVQVYHLLFDMLVFFIHLIHNFMDKFDNLMY